MKIMDFPWLHQVNEIATAQAGRVSRSTGVEMEEVHSEMWAWIIDNRDKVDDLVDNEELGSLEFFLYILGRRYGLREKAKRTGYLPQDLHFYSKRALVELLPDAWDYEGWGSSGSIGDGMPRAKSDPRFASDRVAMLVDIKLAVESLSLNHYNLLIWKYKYEYTNAMLAAELGCSEGAADKRADRAIEALQKALGGPDPEQQYVGARRVMSNAQSRARTEI